VVWPRARLNEVMEVCVWGGGATRVAAPDWHHPGRGGHGWATRQQAVKAWSLDRGGKRSLTGRVMTVLLVEGQMDSNFIQTI
jgi:hypothetical protein